MSPGQLLAVPVEEFARILGGQLQQDVEQLCNCAVNRKELVGGHIALEGLGEGGVGGAGVERDDSCMGIFAAVFDRNRF